MYLYQRETVNFLLLVLLVEIVLTQQETCTSIEKEKCQLFTLCSKKTVKILKECRGLLTQDDKLPTCQQNCRNLIIEFWTNHQVGRELSMCDCEGNVQCHIFRERFNKCKENKNSTVMVSNNSCTKYTAECKNDKACYRLYKNWFNSCTDLISGDACTATCLHLEKLLYNHTIGFELSKCNCDGFYDDDKFCREVRFNREKLCIKSIPNQSNQQPSLKPLPSQSIQVIPGFLLMLLLFTITLQLSS